MWLSTKNIGIDQLSKKLDHKMMDFFEVIGKKNILLELQLLQAIKIHNIFHLNLLWKASTNPLTSQLNQSAPPVIINNKEKWEVKNIFDARSF